MCEVCGDNRFVLIEKHKKKLCDGTNIEMAKDEMAVIDSILFRFWQMGWLDKIEKSNKTAWISVEERLPENSNHYLVCANTHYGTNFVTLALYTISCGWNGVRVTHWMPLPEPPKKGDKTDA